MKEWYYARENEQIGPIGEKDLLDLIKQKVVKVDDLVWTQGMEDWRKAEEVKVLESLFNNPAPPAVPNKDTVNESDREQKDSTSFVESKYFWPLIIVVSVIYSMYMGGSSIVFILGQTIPVIVVPGIITLIISGLMRLFKKKINRNQFNTIFLILWISVLLLSLIGSFLAIQ